MEDETIVKFIQKQSYQQPSFVNGMYDAEKQMKEIMEAPQRSAVEKNNILSYILNLIN